MRDRILLRQLQSLPLHAKITLAEQRIMEWYKHFDGNVYISFSGGKDSTVLTHLVHGIYPDVPLVFANTGLEYPEIRRFAESMGAEPIYPRMRFDQVISKYGYPLISKEVSEAIYYARKIIAKSPESLDSPERERERESTALRAEQDRAARTTGRYAENCRTEQQSGEEQTSRTRSRISGIHSAAKRDELHGRPRERERERDEKSSDSENSCSANSQFNKEKWLPLCQETQFAISHLCCDIMKKRPFAAYSHKTHRYPYIGSMADESRLRAQAWIRHGCNAFDGQKKTSQPMSLWTEQDVLQYIRKYEIEICSVYGEVMSVDSNGLFYDPMPGIDCKLKCTGCQRTGCIWCALGAQFDKGLSRYQRLAITHPKQYEYCMNGGQWVDNPRYDPSAPVMEGDWKNWNPKKIWVPSKKGLGMRKVFEDVNQLYGKDFIRYE